jgi:hypothetical protein
MTLIASWVATDDKPKGKSISAVYFCSDSRFSWTLNGKIYDMGKKTYVCNNYPEIFCFCGDVDFPTTTLQSLISEIDNGLLFSSESSFDEKRDSIADYILQALEQYPKEVLTQNFVIYYCTCIKHQFYLAEFRYNGKTMKAKTIDLPTESTKVFSDGSGKKLFENLWNEANRPYVNEWLTSRNVYNCFVRTLDEAKLHLDDENLNKVGGSPQMVGLYRSGKTNLYGIVRGSERFIQGRKVLYSPCLNSIEWRNDNFERVDPQTMELLSGAQPQPFASRKKGK